MTLFLALTAILLYLGGASLMTIRALRGESYSEVRALLITASAIALLCHGAVNLNLLLVDGGLNLGFFTIASTIAWFIALIGLGSSIRTVDLEPLLRHCSRMVVHW